MGAARQLAEPAPALRPVTPRGATRLSAQPATLPGHRPYPVPRRRPAPATAPGRRRRGGSHKRGTGRRLVSRTASAVGHLPESGMVRGIVGKPPFWICAIGVAVIMIVFLNVASMSFSARASKLETEIQMLEQRNSILQSSQTQALAMPRIHHQAVAAGMAMPAPDEINYLTFSPGDFAAAAGRLAAEGG